MKNLLGIALLAGLPIDLAKAAPEADPVSVAPAISWYGYDGTWSAVNILSGSNLSTNTVFPSTVDRNSQLIGARSCETPLVPDCSSKRGGLFSANESTTWKGSGKHAASKDSSTQEYFGSDALYLGVQEFTEDPILIVNDTDTWVGSLGLAVDMGDRDGAFGFSVMETAFINTSVVPSSSYGYTAGAYYRLKGVPASLTLGGVDKARFYEGNTTFHLSRSGIPVISLNSLYISSGTQTNNVTRLNKSINPSNSAGSAYYTLDSSTSYLWLPESAFQAFGYAFNLTYDDRIGFYTYGNDTSLRDRLLRMNISISFSISDLPNAAENVNITLPFQAFNHELTYPYPNLPPEYSNTSLPYLPVKKASTDKEQRIGRVFFQEAYLTVNYETGLFNVEQAKFDPSLVTTDGTDIETIHSQVPDGLADDIFKKKGGLSIGTKAGIGVGCGSAAIAIILASAYFFIRRRQQQQQQLSIEAEKKEDSTNSGSKPDSASHGLVELQSGCDRTELASDASHEVFELPGSEPPELEAGSSTRRYSSRSCRGDEKRVLRRHSETRSSIAASLASRLTESSAEDSPEPQKGQQEGPPKYTP
ncbi:hypothetical protein EYZ11_005457 [Aspergillus tanneri]|nr:hypothetical protein EYZ11_005457 [Aspergillus tanneri]